MNVSEAIRLRKSVRGFKSQPVPQEVLRQILETAIHSPSAMNTQPWEISIVSGKALDDLKQANSALLASGAKPNDEKIRYQGVFRQRQVDLAIQLFKLMDIAREDKVKRAQWNERGFRFFNAPAAIIISLDQSVEQTLAPYDIGIFCQSVCLIAMEYGLGTCIEDQGVMFPDKVRELLRIPQGKTPVLAIAIGHPDWDFPANRIESAREPLENVAKWYGF